MKTKLQLDYPAILANTARPVHLALTFDAPEVTGARSQPVAFAAVIDRSGSMGGAPLVAAKKAVRTAFRNLRRGDPASFGEEVDSARLAPQPARLPRSQSI